VQHLVPLGVEARGLLGLAAGRGHAPDLTRAQVVDAVRTPREAVAQVGAGREDRALLVRERESYDLRVAARENHAPAVRRERSGVDAGRGPDLDRIGTVEPANVESPLAVAESDHRDRATVRRNRQAGRHPRHDVDFRGQRELDPRGGVLGSATRTAGGVRNAARPERERPNREGERGSRQSPRNRGRPGTAGAPRREIEHRGGLDECPWRIRERQPRVADVAQPVLRVALEAAADELAHARRQPGRQPPEVDLLAQHRRERVDHAPLGEQALARQHLVEHHADRPDVGPFVDRPAARLRRRHVRRRAENHPLARAAEGDRGRVSEVHRQQSGAAEGIEGLRQPEVEDFDLPVHRSLDVLRLQVSMNDPLLVRLFEGVSDLQRNE
jgi:hypothetical protein